MPPVDRHFQPTGAAIAPDIQPRPIGALFSFVKCMAGGLDPARFGFQDPDPWSCMDAVTDEWKCTFILEADDSCRRVALRHRGAVDPNAGVWQPRPAYVTWLALQRRLPYQVDMERRGILVAVPSYGFGQQRAPSRDDEGKSPPPPSSGVSFCVLAEPWLPHRSPHRAVELAL